MNDKNQQLVSEISYRELNINLFDYFLILNYKKLWISKKTNMVKKCFLLLFYKSCSTKKALTGNLFAMASYSILEDVVQTVVVLSCCLELTLATKQNKHILIHDMCISHI